jgi:hypothetical protein
MCSGRRGHLYGKVEHEVIGQKTCPLVSNNGHAHDIWQCPRNEPLTLFEHKRCLLWSLHAYLLCIFTRSASIFARPSIHKFHLSSKLKPRQQIFYNELSTSPPSTASTIRIPKNKDISEEGPAASRFEFL